MSTDWRDQASWMLKNLNIKARLILRKNKISPLKKKHLWLQDFTNQLKLNKKIHWEEAQLHHLCLLKKVVWNIALSLNQWVHKWERTKNMIHTITKNKKRNTNLLHLSQKILQHQVRTKLHQVMTAQKLHSFNNLQLYKKAMN